MRLLLYGFGPYREFKENITQKILKKFPAHKELKKIVFPVRFDKNQFVKVLRRYRPDAVLGLGQCSDGRSLRIELRAVNKRREHNRQKLRPIIIGGPRSLSTSLKVQKQGQAKPSTHAGDYVCNYSMYVILNYLRCHRLPTRFAFVHIPHRYSVTRARSFLLQAVKKLR